MYFMFAKFAAHKKKPKQMDIQYSFCFIDVYVLREN